MSVNTSNVYGKISISDSAIAKVAKNATLECYGIVDTVSSKLTDSIGELFKKQPMRLILKVPYCVMANDKNICVSYTH